MASFSEFSALYSLPVQVILGCLFLA